jgi:hypothetical protein
MGVRPRFFRNRPSAFICDPFFEPAVSIDFATTIAAREPTPIFAKMRRGHADEEVARAAAFA